MTIFKKRFPGQQPKKGQIKEIKRELIEAAKNSSKANKQKNIAKTSNRKRSNGENKIDTLAKAMFEKRFPGQQPKKEQLKEIRKELIEARKKIGL